MKLLDPDHPFFAPAWRRVAVAAVCLGWALFELLTGAVFWAIIFGALGIYCVYVFFLASKPQQPDRRDQP